jgi:uncharacterized membrane protein YagU involved in acid resistance
MSTTQQRDLGSVTRPLIRGAEASAIGTLVMDATLYRRYRGGGGTDGFWGWETSEGPTSWENAPAPALAAKRILDRVLGHEVSPRYVRLLGNVTHWGFGLAAGAGYGLILGSRRAPPVWEGLPFGAAVWISGYLVLPELGVYKPIWKYDLETLWEDLSVHLVFGTATAAAFRVLTPKKDRD